VLQRDRKYIRPAEIRNLVGTFRPQGSINVCAGALDAFCSPTKENRKGGRWFIDVFQEGNNHLLPLLARYGWIHSLGLKVKADQVNTQL